MSPVTRDLLWLIAFTIGFLIATAGATGVALARRKARP